MSTTTFEGREILKVTPEALTYLANAAFHDTNFFLRSTHLAQVAAIQAGLAVRIASAGQSPSAPRRQEDDRLISVEDAAERLGVTPRWMYRHAGHLPFSRRLSRKALRFSELGLKRWQAAQGPGR